MVFWQKIWRSSYSLQVKDVRVSLGFASGLMSLNILLLSPLLLHHLMQETETL
jgi:hypothetical protein